MASGTRSRIAQKRAGVRSGTRPSPSSARGSFAITRRRNGSYLSPIVIVRKRDSAPRIRSTSRAPWARCYQRLPVDGLEVAHAATLRDLARASQRAQHAIVVVARARGLRGSRHPGLDGRPEVAIEHDVVHRRREGARVVGGVGFGEREPAGDDGGEDLRPVFLEPG